jgi:hypothetical protein
MKPEAVLHAIRVQSLAPKQIISPIARGILLYCGHGRNMVRPHPDWPAMIGDIEYFRDIMYSAIGVAFLFLAFVRKKR